MPRKKQTGEKPPKEAAVSDTTTPGTSQEEAEAIPFAEIIAEMGSDDEKADVPYFAEAAATPTSTSASDNDALDAAIQEARTPTQPAQDKPAHSPVIAYEQPGLMAIPEQKGFPVEISPPPLIVLAAAAITLIFLLACN